MAAHAGGDYLAGEDLDDLFELLEGGFLDEDVDFNVELDAVITEVEAYEEVGYPCQDCDKICKSQRGLTRHRNVKHTTEVTPEISTNAGPSLPKLTKEEQILKKLHPLKLKVLITKSAEICLGDQCLPKSTREVFRDFKVSNDDAVKLWEKLKPIIGKYNGDAEDFYANFYGLLKDNLLPSKFEDTTLSNIILTELANHVLIHLSGNDKVVDSVTEAVTPISENEQKSLQYVAGFIVHKLYTKFRFSKKSQQSEFNKQAVSILQACKVDCDDSQTLINIRDRGGLWRVNKQIQELFRECEKMFRLKTSNLSTTLNCQDLVKNMLKNCSVLSNFKSVCYTIDPQVSKEVSMNLLEHMLTMFTRVRSFSYARDIREKHKAAKKLAKKRSLRTEIKKASSSKDMGH